jgi:transposase
VALPQASIRERANPGERFGKAGRQMQKQLSGLPILRPDVAGIDLGSERHWVCAPTIDGQGREVNDFGATTAELVRMAQWLTQRGVKSVAMESTGVYWIAPHEILEGQGFEVLLADTRQLSSVPGRNRKSDPTDCEWLQRLHSCGLVRGSFRPPEQVCMLRTLIRDKSNLVAERSDWIRRLQKGLDQMNVRLHRAVSDLDGATGMAILRAIAAGERDPRQLARLRDRGCRKTEEEIAEQMYDAIEQRIADYDREILRLLNSMTPEQRREQSVPALKNQPKMRSLRKRGQEPARQALFRMSGVDMTQIDAVGVETVQVVLSEYGPDLSCFPTEKHFISHATLAPRLAKSGNKPIRKKKRNSASTRVAAALRMAALSVRQSQTALGAYYRNIARRIGADVAVFATARKLASFIYRLLRWGQPYVDEGAEAFERRYQERRILSLASSAKQLGYELTPAST